MNNYYFSVNSRSDLRNINNYTLENWGQIRANKYINELYRIVFLITNKPGMGTKTVVSTFKSEKEIFSFPFKSHIIYYIKHKEGITIMRILHKNMLPKIST